MSWIQYAIFIAMMIGAIILHEKFKNSKFLNNNLLKLFTLLIIVFALVVEMIFIFKGIKVFKERPSMTCLVIGGLQFMIYRAPRMNRILF